MTREDGVVVKEVTFLQLLNYFQEWEAMARNGECVSYEEYQATPIDVVAQRNAEDLFSSL